MPWMGTETVAEKVEGKKRCYRAFLDKKSPTNWYLHRMTKNEANKVVAVAEEDLYKKLDARQMERELCKLARTRYHRTHDVIKFLGVNDEDGNSVTEL
ncbi:hypothetical protein ANCCAN_22379 [Ancylostoma caninum]|uniref:Uncharacterized protein n=1 Tax=Ancylostoma caninum TaxID=29170 RepID=A0A368FLV6_ANCCA|nr:hypothetical protein ANCCAN_22379 [Ancylostoma caninum]